LPTFSERLKQLRAEKKVTQRDVALFLDITDRAYQYYEYGSREPSIGVAQKLADYFNVQTDYLIGRSDDRGFININPMSRYVLSDNQLNLAAKGLYMQFQNLSLDGKVKLPDEEKFLMEQQITKKEYDGIISELESAGYIKTVSTAEGKNSEKNYLLI